MAQRRMFNKSITNSSAFLRMPSSSRLLYYDLGMNADDDGYVEHFMVLRMTGATQQDLGVLELNGLVKVFDDNVLWIKDWKENNYIQKDRYTPSKYLAVYNVDTLCIQDVYTGKDSIGKYSIDNNICAKKSANAIENDALKNAFDKFWKAYPKKKDKSKAQKWFMTNKPSEELINKILKQIERFKDTDEWKRDNGQFIPYPTSWLNGRRWEDEFETEQERDERIQREVENDLF